MSVFDSQIDSSALQARLAGFEGLTIVCYCAAWCDTCTQYRPGFEALADQYAQHVFVWVDIEENPELLEDEDVENFPTLLIQAPRGNLFYGVMLPYASHLDRLIGRCDAGTPVVAEGPAPLRQLLQTQP